MSHEDNNAGLPKTQEFGGQKIFFQNFFWTISSICLYMLQPASGKFLASQETKI